MSDLDLGFLGLSPFGLTCHEQLALHPYSSAESLAELLGAPLDEVAAELAEQAERGQARQVGGSWIAQDLAAWLDARHARQHAEHAQAAAERARQRSALLRSHIPAVYRQGTRKLVIAGGTETINHGDVALRIVELVEHATISLRVMLTDLAGFDHNPRSDHNNPVVEAMIRAALRGVRLSSVWTPECIDAARSGPTRRLPPLGWLRSNPDVPYRAILADDETVLVQRDPDDITRGALVLTHQPTVALYANLIDSLYAGAQHLVPPDPADASEARIRQRDSQIVTLIAKGATNEMIGHQLHCSTRTAQRIVSRLMDKYEARSRAELVSKAADLLPPTLTAS
ncbi:helix-turn-helix transcriptional regulator [Frankia sp. CNm7]|uniref:Helix-turn-helix transcriptional regulator n=1 Tax=Frankia nepalensis TaxID=1836974 RepID=A0A937RAA8_9ACTN|nr:helix-turn-helix transcriptional regulator [Frankia nepalensis]MBL7495466.1 helix-turn-helix transcriptional regulator [Frankia nepalensis]MBL7510193.1 helix-turn-helix transcriptional regulator [Frankia nepalensis]MBL7517165.1 helix-turn-helix transcriptional regulator [Frankia nepalensis]MBL7626022.1 helix-turn-helix transcriptional regulator [Frankia nepalensis]